MISLERFIIFIRIEYQNLAFSRMAKPVAVSPKTIRAIFKLRDEGKSFREIGVFLGTKNRGRGR